MTETLWLRTATPGEAKAAMPYFIESQRLGRPPTTFLWGSKIDQTPEGIVAVAPDTSSPFDGRNYQIEPILLGDGVPTANGFEELIQELAKRLAPGHFVSTITADDSREAEALRGAGFSVCFETYSYLADIAVCRKVLGRFTALTAEWANVQKVKLKPYPSIERFAAEKLIVTELGGIPRGHYVMLGESESSKDYGASYWADQDGHCVGLVIISREGDEIFVECIISDKTHQGSPLSAFLLNGCAANDVLDGVKTVRFDVNAQNRQGYTFVRAFEAEPVARRVKLVRAITH